MKYSFILPIYNVEAYLEDCVASILAQTYTDYEVILVDDGSKDSSPIICDRLAEQDTRIKVIHKKNGGQADARNVGVSIANGDYIIFIDSDDFIIEDYFLEKIDRLALDFPDLIYYKHQKYYSDSKRFEVCKYSYQSAMNEPSYPKKIYSLVKSDAFWGMAWIKAIKLDVIKSGNIRFDTSLKCEDMDWNYCLMLNSNSLELIDESFVAYRQREGSVTSTFKLKNLTDFIFILEKWSDRINKSDLDIELRSALLGSLAKYYSNMLVVYSRLKDIEKKKYRKRIKELSWLLKHGMSKRPKTIGRLYTLIGFDMTIFFLQVVDRIKK